MKTSRIKFSVLILATVFFLFSCSKEEEKVPAIEDQKSLTESLESFDQEVSYEVYEEDGLKRGRFVKRVPTFSTLVVALAKTDLLKTVIREELTVFAPTDAAFAKLGLYPYNISNVPNLEEILLYHVIPGKVRSNDLSDGFFNTLSGAAVKVDIEPGKVMVDESTVIYANRHFVNGVIHIIDNVLFPPASDIVDIAIAASKNTSEPEFKTLVAAVVSAGLVDALKADGPFTVFAPTDAAFAKLGLNASNIASTPGLADILKHHVIPAGVYSNNLFDGTVETLNGSLEISATNLTIGDEEANLILENVNIRASNGVIHAIDEVLIP